MSQQMERQALKPNPALKGLEGLVGEWEVTATHPMFPGGVHGHSSIAWMEGGALLSMHGTFEKPGPPSGTMVIGRDDSLPNCTMLYYDERGVSRIYQLVLSGNVWKMWRDAPGFWQRFTGTISPDGQTIRALWEKSSDGVAWEDDLKLVYRRT